MPTSHIALVFLALLGGCLLTGCRGRQSVPHVALAARPTLPALPVFLYPGWKPTPKLFWIGTPKGKPPLVALTFDAGNDASAVALILKTLALHHAHATFFLTGKFCEQYPRACRAIANAGMEIGSHSYSHPYFTKISQAQIKQELEHAEAAITAVCGRGAKPLFRFPYGECNTRTRHDVCALGYQPVHWTLDSQDSFGKPKSAKFVARRFVSRIKPGYITLMHVSRIQSAKALSQIFKRLDKTGIRAVPVSELMRRESQ